MVSGPSDDITVPTGTATDTILAFLTDPKHLAIAAACLLVAVFLVRLWRAIPKGLLVPLVIVGLIVVGVLRVH